MKLSWVSIVGLIMIGAAVPQAAASSITCLALAPLTNACEGEVYFPNGLAWFDDDVEGLEGFTGLTLEYFPRLNPTSQNPAIYSPTASYTCTTAIANGCDVVDPFVLVAPAGSAFLLRVTLAGSPAGLWGWEHDAPGPFY